MCHIKMIVIGDSDSKAKVMKVVRNTCVSMGLDDVVFNVDSFRSQDNLMAIPDMYDIAVMDEQTFGKPCSKSIIGFGTPTLQTCDVQESNGIFKSVINNAVTHSRIREKIVSATENIREISLMMEDN